MLRSHSLKLTCLNTLIQSLIFFVCENILRSRFNSKMNFEAQRLDTLITFPYDLCKRDMKKVCSFVNTILKPSEK